MPRRAHEPRRDALDGGEGAGSDEVGMPRTKPDDDDAAGHASGYEEDASGTAIGAPVPGAVVVVDADAGGVIWPFAASQVP